MFNPITNQPLSDYKSQQEQMQKEREKKINELYNLQERNDKIENKDYIKNKKEQIPMEYNPYKNVLILNIFIKQIYITKL